MNLIIQGGALPTFLLERIVSTTGATTVEPRPPQVVRLHGATRTPEFDALIPLIEAEKLDFAFVDRNKRLSDFGLICFDMDSTLITIECIDELADYAGKKEEVSAVTESAMRGEIDNRESLRRRLSLLAGLDGVDLVAIGAGRIGGRDGAGDLQQVVVARGGAVHGDDGAAGARVHHQAQGPAFAGRVRIVLDLRPPVVGDALLDDVVEHVRCP